MTIERVALVSMPWMSASLPSIQLATMEAVLRQAGLTADVHELYVDFAALLTIPFYEVLSNGSGFVEEWLFARHYFGPEIGDTLDGFKAHHPRIGLRSVEIEDQVLDALFTVTAGFLDRACAETDWSKYDIVGFSLTISQVAASMALARRLKLAHPHLKIVFGGNACAGPAGSAIMRMCRYVDAVVRVEGEEVFPELVGRLRRGESLDDVPGISFRTPEGGVEANPPGALYSQRSKRPHLDYDSYFARLKRLELDIGVWLPFESSRGCWWGEKSQCTFCGLHEIMKSREWDWKDVIAELEDWAARYGVTNFFAVDLILPRHYYETLLAELARRDSGWRLFYEIKANVNRRAVERLAQAGVRWIQPGIESLDREVLELMRKGVQPLQNVQLLKWCRELDIRVTWNVILGTPGESPAAYPVMAERMRRLFHLPPPTGRTEFALHRFSPYHATPAEFGITNVRPAALYRQVFPVDDSILEDFVYQFDYDIEGRTAVPSQYAEPVMTAIREWRAAYERGAELVLETDAEGAGRIIDRRLPEEKSHRLDPAECALYRLLDASTTESLVASVLESRHPKESAALAARGGVQPILDEWERHGLVMREGGKVLALANTPRDGHPLERDAAPEPAPVRYLVRMSSEF
jgi:ribosomal peptide maturation radical SAM protein 1